MFQEMVNSIFDCIIIFFVAAVLWSCDTNMVAPVDDTEKVVLDTIFPPDSLPADTVITFKISFYAQGSEGCFVYCNGNILHYITYAGTRRFTNEITNGSLINVKYVIDTALTDTISKYCIARNNCTWYIN